MSDPETTQTPEDLIRASIFLEYYGSSSHDPQKWHKWRFAETDYAPEWLSEAELGCDRDKCVTVLDFSLAQPEPPKGWRLAYQYQAGEKPCPDCGDGTGEEHERSACKLCEGDGLLYWGEECVVVVFAPITADALLSELRELLKGRDDTGALPGHESRRFFELFESLDGLASSDNLPEDWQ